MTDLLDLKSLTDLLRMIEKIEKTDQISLILISLIESPRVLSQLRLKLQKLLQIQRSPQVERATSLRTRRRKLVERTARHVTQDVRISVLRRTSEM